MNGIAGNAIALKRPATWWSTAATQALEYLWNAARLVALWHERARQRSALDQLDSRFLRDLGIARFDAELESNKPFWR